MFDEIQGSFSFDDAETASPVAVAEPKATPFFFAEAKPLETPAEQSLTPEQHATARIAHWAEHGPTHERLKNVGTGLGGPEVSPVPDVLTNPFNPRSIARKLPFVGGALAAADVAPLISAADRIKAGKGTEEDFKTIGTSIGFAREKQDEPLHRKVLDVVSDIPGFATEFGLTGGVYSGVKAGVVKALPKIALNQTGKLLVGGAARAAGVAAQTAVNPALIARNTAERMRPEIAGGEGEAFLQALPKGLLDSAIEVGSERAGSLISQIPVPQRLKALQAGITKRWLAAKPGRTMADLYKKVAEPTGWNGVIGEMFEERTGDVARLATGLEKPEENVTGQLATGDWKQAADQLLVEGLAFSVPGAANLAGQVAANTLDKFSNQPQDHSHGANGNIPTGGETPPNVPPVTEGTPNARQITEAAQPNGSGGPRSNEQGASVSGEGIPVSGQGGGQVPGPKESSEASPKGTTAKTEVNPYHPLDARHKTWQPGQTEAPPVTAVKKTVGELPVAKPEDQREQLWKDAQAIASDPSNVPEITGTITEQAVDKAARAGLLDSREAFDHLVDQLAGVPKEEQAKRAAEVLNQMLNPEAARPTPEPPRSSTEPLAPPATAPEQQSTPAKQPHELALTEFENAGHEPWQVTQRQWVEMQRTERRRLGQSEYSGTHYAPYSDYEEYHKGEVEQAVKEGKPVSPEVLATYAKPEPAERSEAEIEAAMLAKMQEKMGATAEAPAEVKPEETTNYRPAAIMTRAIDEYEGRYNFKNLPNSFAHDAVGKLKEGMRPHLRGNKSNEIKARAILAQATSFDDLREAIRVFSEEPKKSVGRKNLSEKAADARQEFEQSMDEAAAVIRKFGLGVNQVFNPEIAAAVAKMGAKAVKAGVYTFADFTNEFAKKIARDKLPGIKQYLQHAWDTAVEIDTTGKSKPADYETFWQQHEKEHANAGQTEQPTAVPGVENGPGEPGANAAEVSSKPARKRRPGKRAESASTGTQPNAEPTAGSVPAGAAGDVTGNGAAGASDTGKRKLGGRGTTKSTGAEETQPLAEQPIPERKPEPVEVRDVNAQNHVIKPDAVLAVRSEKKSLANNIAAIKLLKQLEEQTRNATPEEKDQLAKFTGWGGLSQAFDRRKGEAMVDDRVSWMRDEAWERKWGQAYREIKDLLTPEEWEAARDTTINAHYTSREVIQKMWSIAEHLGFRGGRVLEPGAGVGHFAGLVPASVRGETKFSLVELDAVSSRLLKKLYPEAHTFGMGMEEFRAAPGSLDLVIGNVPFAKEGPADASKRYGQNLNLHNYFLARSLDAVRPGGLVVAISTHNTLDAAQEQRKLLASKGELLGAIRLPNDAFKDNAKTEVVTDILIFRKPFGLERMGEPFTNTEAVTLRNESDAPIEKRVNEYFANHPEMILGEQAAVGSMYGKDEYTVVPTPGNLAEKLDTAMENLPANVFGDQQAQGEIVEAGPEQGTKEGLLRIEDGQLQLATGGAWVDVTAEGSIEGYPAHLFGAAGIKRAAGYIGIRDAYSDLRKVMLSADSTDAEIKAGQEKLEQFYDDYTAEHGQLNEGKTRIFQTDPEFYRVLSLEHRRISRNKDTGAIRYVYEKASVFNKRTLGPREAPSSVSTVKDGLWVSLGYRGGVDADYIAQLTGKSVEEVTDELINEGLAYKDPATQALAIRERYLSGNVREKLRQAEIAAEDDASYQVNVDALKAVQPERVPISKVSARLGGNWIPPDVATAFAQRIFDDRYAQAIYGEQGDAWTVVAQKNNAAVEQQWGTGRVNASEILADALNLRTPKVMDKVPTGETDDRGREKYTLVLNELETVAAKAKLNEMQKEFRKLIDTNEKVAAALEDAYNHTFNAYVDPVYNGSHLELPGANTEIELRPYQKNAIWRNLLDRYSLMAHAVGAGKTYTMIATAMEMRRLGLAKRPLLVVQNATLGQFAKSFMEMYPNANVMVADKDDLQESNRHLFLSRITSGDWEAVVMAQSTFDRLANNPETAKQFVNDQLAALEEAIHEEGGREKNPRANSATVKDLVKARKALEKQLDKILETEKKNEGKNLVHFEDLHSDALFLDEAHAYKKPFFITKLDNLVGLNKQASARGVSTMMKVRTIQNLNQGKNVFFATGTPITNTLGEAWHMMNFVAPHVNEDFGVKTFDGFVGAFALKDTVREMNAGGQWVPKDALVKFTNGPELIRYLRAGWDILSPDDLKAYMTANESALPELKDGKVQAVTVDQTPGVAKLMEFMKSVYARFKAMPAKDRREYSYIPAVAYGAAKAGSLDIRLVYPEAAEEADSKLNRAVDLIHEEWDRSTDKKGVQLFFSDVFNPRSMETLHNFMAGEHANVDVQDSGPQNAEGEEEQPEREAFLFQELKKKLIAKGVPAGEIAIVGEANTDTKRDVLFERANSGDVRILLGSSAKMGVGVNVQKKLVALHHFDAPWLPADVEQREGRIIRFGNENKQISIYRYAMKNTLDAAIFSKTIRKAKFIWQTLAGKSEGRDFDDPASQTTMSIEEQLAAIQGDPLLFLKMDLDRERRDLELEREAHQDSIQRSKSAIRDYQAEINRTENETIPNQRAEIEFASQVNGEEPQITHDGKVIDDPKEIDAAIKQLREENEERVLKLTKGKKIQEGQPGRFRALDAKHFQSLSAGFQIGPYRGHISSGAFTVAPVAGKREWVTESIFTLNRPGSTYNLYEGNATTGMGLWRAVAALPERLEGSLRGMQERVAQRRKEISDLEAVSGNPWTGQDQLDKVTARLAEIETELYAKGANTAAPAAEDTEGEEKGLPASAGQPVKRIGDKLTDQEKLANLKKWFGDSKVVDDNGQPLKVYHGTPDTSDIREFKLGHGFHTEGFLGDEGRVIYFTERPNKADAYAENGVVLPVYLRISNPYFDDMDSPPTLVYEKAIEGGHDGIQVANGDWIVFDKSQVKSASGNSGEYSAETGNIKGLPAQPAKKKTVGSKKSTPATQAGTTGSNSPPQVPTYEPPDYSTWLVGPLKQLYHQIKATIAPASMGPEARGAARGLRSILSRRARLNDIAMERQAKVRKFFARRENEENLDYMDTVEHGKDQPIPELQEAALMHRDLLDTETQAHRDLGEGWTQYARENYFPHYWKDPAAAKRVFDSVYGKNPLQGSKAFQKKRTIEFIKEGIDRGLKLASYNPVDLVNAKLVEMQKYRTAQEWLKKEAIPNGYAVFVNVNKVKQQKPAGYEQYLDPMFTVYGPPTITLSEYVDQDIYNGLDEVLSALGVNHNRKTSVGKRRLGVSITGGDEIQTQNATAMSVKTHELGHQIDDKFGMQQIFGAGNAKSHFARELQAIADLRYEGEAGENASQKAISYGQTPSEQMADVVAAYVTAPDRMKEVAPVVYQKFDRFVKRTPKLRRLAKVKAGLALKKIEYQKAHGGRLVMGHYYGPPNCVRLANNMFRQGIADRSRAFRGVLAVNSSMNMFSLGWSLWHGTTTAGNSVQSQQMLAIKALSTGHVKTAGKALALGTVGAPLSPLLDARLGRQILKEWRAPGTYPMFSDLVDKLESGGYRGIDKEQSQVITKEMMKLFSEGSPLQKILAIRKIPAFLTEQSMRPIMEFMVPWIKAGVAGRRMLYEMERQKNMSYEDARIRGTEIVDSIDNQLGQIVYDNLFWPRWFKDMYRLLARAPGWTHGGQRLFVGAPVDTYQQVKKLFKGETPEITWNMAFAMSLPIFAGMAGALIQYLMCGILPEDWKDLYYPRTGGKDSEGRWERLNIPGYFKEQYSYLNNVFDASGNNSIIKTLKHKTSPIVNFGLELAANEDYYGTKIRNPDDDWDEQVKDFLKHIGKQYVPFSVTGAKKLNEENAPLRDQVLPALGLTPASAAIIKSPAENLAGELQYHAPGSRTKESAAKAAKRRELVREYQKHGKDAQPKIMAAVKAGEIEAADAREIIKRAGSNYLENAVSKLGAKDSLKVYRVATLKEKARIYWNIQNHIANNQTADLDQKQAMLGELGEPPENAKGDEARVKDSQAEFIGSQAYVLTAPPPKLQAGERPAKYRERVAKHTASVKQAKASLESLGLASSEIRKQLKASATRRGDKITSQSFFDRLGRLNHHIHKGQ